MSIQAAVKKAATPGRLVEGAVGGAFGVTKFVENFDALVNVAGSAKHLKDLVLKLAVSGRLSPTNNETADALLTALRRKRLSLAKTGIRIGENSPPVTDEEAPYTIPRGWRWVRLRDVGGFLGGGTPSKSNTAFWKGPLPWVSPKDMKRSYIDDAEDHISTAAVEGSAVKLIPAQSVLCVVRGMILAHSFPVAVTMREVTINQDMKALVLAMPELSEFLLRSCQAARTRVLAKVERSSHGTCRLESEAVEMLPIALPPLAEQKRIVERVDQLMALIDDLEGRQTKKREVSARFTRASLEALTTAEGPEEFQTAWKRVVENFPAVIDRAEKVAELKRSILELAVRGALTAETEGDIPPNVEGEPASVAAPFPIRLTWRWVRLERLCERITKGSSPKWQGVSYVDSADKGVLFVTSENVGGGQMLLDEPKYVEKRFNEIEPRSILRQGDLLMNIVGASIGRAAIFDRPERANINQAVCLIRLEDGAEVEPAFLLRFFNSPTCVGFMFDKQVDNARANLSMGNIARFLVPLPPRAEQKRILAKVEHLMKLCDDLEAKLRRAEDRASKLLEAVVQAMVV